MGATLQDFAPRLRYVPGKLNHIADALSRMHGVQKDEGTAPLVFKKESNGDITIAYAKQMSDTQTRVHCMMLHAKMPSTVTVRFVHAQAFVVNVWTEDELIKAQENDIKLAPLIDYLKYGTREAELPQNYKDFFILHEILTKKNGPS
ncbi:unnamed protein product [Rotaria socialis]|uniref:Uncharacterized protein n=1 Tax=Rotaria socialis TaxID=392032 RepID=A0A821WE35_9BILA|nr:unnamed protein product [Rotaria socialis]CAF4925281.1 unnamed protein product [Rotaria socialis]